MQANDRTREACRLKAENLQFALDELTRMVPTREREKGRAVEGIGTQVTSPKCIMGIQIAARRGLQCL
eukprot:13208092-Alexandrium_andersonii.AAC.1